MASSSLDLFWENFKTSKRLLKFEKGRLWAWGKF